MVPRRRWAGGMRCRAGGVPGVSVPPRVGRADGGSGPRTCFDVELTARYGRAAVIEISGEIDLRTSRVLQERLTALVEDGVDRVVVDFGRVLFCDASGLGTLVAAYNKVSGRGGGIRLARVAPAQRRLIEITGLDRLFALHESVEGALGEGWFPAAPSMH